MSDSSHSCLFCRVVAGSIPAQVVAESEHAIAFLDLHPQAPGHTLVIPKVHARSLRELPQAEVGPLFSLVQEVDDRLTETLEAPGMTIGINQGEAAGQGVDHLHVHLMPRFEGDGGNSIHVVVDNTATDHQTTLINSLLT